MTQRKWPRSQMVRLFFGLHLYLTRRRCKIPKDLPLYIFAPEKVPLSKNSDDVIACDLWFGSPPNQKSCLRLWPVPKVMSQTTTICIIIRFWSRWKTQTNEKLSTIEWFATLWNNSDSTSSWQLLLLSPLLSPLLLKATIAMPIHTTQRLVIL